MRLSTLYLGSDEQKLWGAQLYSAAAKRNWAPWSAIRAPLLVVACRQGLDTLSSLFTRWARWLRPQGIFDVIGVRDG